jgi:hypothetical protein
MGTKGPVRVCNSSLALMTSFLFTSRKSWHLLVKIDGVIVNVLLEMSFAV